MSQTYVRSRLEDAVGLDDVRVREHLQDFQLFLDVGYGGLVACLARLHHEDLAVLLAHRLPQHAAPALAQRLHHCELLFERLRPRVLVSLLLRGVSFPKVALPVVAIVPALSVLSVLSVFSALPVVAIVSIVPVLSVVPVLPVFSVLSVVPVVGCLLVDS